MRKIIFIYMAMLVIQPVVCQKSYKELYESLKTMQDYEAFRALFNYNKENLSKDNANPNLYYQMGIIMQKQMNKLDPFLQSGYAANAIEKSRFYLTLSKSTLNEKEAKKQAEYYSAVTPASQGAKLTYDDIVKDIDARLANIKKLFKFYSTIIL